MLDFNSSTIQFLKSLKAEAKLVSGCYLHAAVNDVWARGKHRRCGASVHMR